MNINETASPAMAGPRLSATEREFFTTLDRVVYGNPFSTERARLIQKLVPDASPEDLALDREALARKVEPRLRSWRDPQRRR